jgi:hypothetical protein
MLMQSFRLFVSSTFADFTAERELLQSKVFPALDAYCVTKGYQFRAIDLKWGVNEQAQLDQRTAEIYLGEVRAAKGYRRPTSSSCSATGTAGCRFPMPSRGRFRVHPRAATR